MQFSAFYKMYQVSMQRICLDIISYYDNVDPAVMGVGPIVAILAVVRATGLEADDIDLCEINEVSLFLINILGNIFS
jgi:Thiolase, C-terminal domain